MIIFSKLFQMLFINRQLSRSNHLKKGKESKLYDSRFWMIFQILIVSLKHMFYLLILIFLLHYQLSTFLIYIVNFKFRSILNIFQHRILRLQKLSFHALLAKETPNNINPIFYGFFKQLLRIPHLKESIDCLRLGAHERLHVAISFLIFRIENEEDKCPQWIRTNGNYFKLDQD